jgi:YesN/AraC family two-component response regulator
VPECVETWHEHILSLACNEGILLLVFAPEAALTHKIINHFPRKDFPRGVSIFASPVCKDSQAALEQLHRLIAASDIRVLLGTQKRYDLVAIPMISEKERKLAEEWLELKDAYIASDYKTYTSLSLRIRQKLKETEFSTHLPAMAEYAGCVFEKEILATQDALFKELEAGEIFLLRSQNKNTDKITAVLQYIDEHYCEELSITGLADMYELSPNYLSTLLKNHQGIKFTDYITKLRIARAKELLLTTSLSVKEISEQVGYHSQSHFTKIFMESVSYTPVEFKKQFSGSSSKE